MSDLVPVKVSVKDRLSEDLQRAKTEGKHRVERIRQIIQDAFSQTFAEVKEGSGEVRTIARGTVSTLKERLELSPDGSEGIDWQHQFNRAKTNYQQLDQQSSVWYSTRILDLRQRLETRLNQLDGQLAERYGDRYQSFKLRLQPFTTWYVNTRAEAEAAGTPNLEQMQTEFGARMSQLGQTVAQKEQQIKQQVKQFLQTEK